MIRKSLRPHQVEAVNRWRKRAADGFGLFHEQRVGKTLPALAIVDIEQPVRALIVTTKKGISVWKKEIKESLVDSKTEFRILNYSQIVLTSRYKKIRKWLDVPNTFMIVDEAHHIKRRGSRWSKRCRLLGKKTQWRLALTGTPIAQGIHDAWAIFNFMDPNIFGPHFSPPHPKEKKKRKDKRVFQTRYCVMGGYQNRKIIDHQNLKEFYRIFHAHCVRRTLREVQKAAGQRPVIIRRVTRIGELGSAARFHYDQLEEELRTFVHRKRIETPLIITQTMKMQQLAGGSILDKQGGVHEVDSKKLNLLSDSIYEIGKDSKPVIVCKFIHELDRIEALLKRRKWRVQTIKGGVEFDANAKITADAILLQIQSGSAIDLSVSDTIIYYSWDYSHINQAQSRFRVLSQTTKRVTYYYLVMKNTVDELILEAVVRKKNFADLVLDYYRRSR